MRSVGGHLPTALPVRERGRPWASRIGHDSHTTHADRLDNPLEREVRPTSGLDHETDVGGAELVKDSLVGGDEQRAQIGDVLSAKAQLMGYSTSAFAGRGYVALDDTGQVALDEERSAGVGQCGTAFSGRGCAARYCAPIRRGGR